MFFIHALYPMLWFNTFLHGTGNLSIYLTCIQAPLNHSEVHCLLWQFQLNRRFHQVSSSFSLVFKYTENKIVLNCFLLETQSVHCSCIKLHSFTYLCLLVSDMIFNISAEFLTLKFRYLKLTPN